MLVRVSPATVRQTPLEEVELTAEFNNPPLIRKEFQALTMSQIQSMQLCGLHGSKFHRRVDLNSFPPDAQSHEAMC
jgi:hypothetical protein